MNKGLFFRRIFTIFFLFSIVFTSTGSNSFASGNITYVDSNGLNPRSSPAYTGGYTIETFTTSGTFTVPAGVSSAEVLIVAGGGGGTVYYSAGYTGGGGAGGLLHGTLTGLSGSYAVTVGDGGVGANGGNSSFGSHTALGGGYATGLYQGGAASGGSGGGSCCASSYSGTAGAAATQGNSSPLTGYGNAGGAGHAIDGVGAWGGGGGGAGGAGGAASYPAGAGSGGAGRAYNISGATTTYAAGGYTGSGAGTANTGNGGGAGQNGGSGIVIVKYLSIDPNLPTVASATSTYITTTSAVLGATIESIGGSSITDRGICYGVSASSTTCTSEGSVGTGSYSLQISGLATSTSYYYYAYAVNSYGTSTTVGAYFTTEGLTNSLMFDSAQSQYLSRTFGTATDGKKWTYSFWVKRSMLYAQNNIQYVLATAGSGAQGVVGFGSANNADEISFTYGGYVRRYTSMQFRDPSAWQHVVLKVDTTATAEADRAIFYVNGVQASMVTPTTISQNDTTQINQAVSTLIGNQTGQAYGRFDGYLSDINFIDGQALTPLYFGKSDSNTGNWIPKAYQGTYGANGFHLTFSSSTALGLDTAPLDATSHISVNSWTTNGGMSSATNQVIDTPFNNFSTLDPLDQNALTLKSGNLTAESTVNNTSSRGNIKISTGKYVWEVTREDNNGDSSNSWFVGIVKSNQVSSGTFYNTPNSYLYYSWNGDRYVGGSSSAGGSSWNTINDVIRCEFDADAHTLAFYKNGTHQFTISSISSDEYTPVVSRTGGTASTKLRINFGQKSFSGTPSSGFKALSIANLPTPTILKPNQHFDVVTRTGTAAGYVKSGIMFQPDFIWSKGRNGATNHYLQDITRGFGASKSLSSNTTGYEAYNGGAPSLHSFNPTVDGYTLNANDSDNNANGTTYVDWLWKAGNSTTTNTAGTITSIVSANPTAGFSIATFTGSGSAGTVGHGLNATPAMVIFKSRDNVGTTGWNVWHQKLTGADYYLDLSTTAAQGNGASNWSGAWSTTTFGLTSTPLTSGADVVAYAFSEVPGYSKFGSYTGNGSADGPFVYTGFKPKYIMTKRVDGGAEHWNIFDTSRAGYNSANYLLYANLSNADDTTTGRIDILSNGFKARDTGSGYNASGATYIYAAFAESVMIPTVPTLPSLSSPTATSTTDSTAVLGGTLDTTGSSNITARGVCYGSTPAPTTNCTAGTGTSTGVFTVSISNLATSTTYYYRAYATNSYGTAYSTDSTFTTEGLTNSLILDNTQSQYLSRTPSVSGNQQKWTWSGWVKRGKIGTGVDIFSAKLTGASYPNTAIAFDNTDAIRVWSYTGSSFKINKYTSALFRDPSTWMHIAVAVDSTDVTAEDRVKLYINGTRVTSFSTNTNPSQNDTFDVNVSGNNHVVGGWGAGSYGYFDGYMSDVYFVDGQQLTPSYFGKTDGTTGNWIPKKYTGTYGTNGFHLQFNNAGLLGADTSGNGNHWSLNGGITATNNQVIDTPINNFAVLTPLMKGSNVTLSAGNLKQTGANSASTYQTSFAPFVMKTGKWYWEATQQSAYWGYIGSIIEYTRITASSDYPGYFSDGYTVDSYDGKTWNNNSTSATYSALPAGGTRMIAYDADAGKLWIGQNGTWFNSGNPASGTGAVFTGIPAGDKVPAFMVYAGTGAVNVNFGQKTYAYTPPTGFKSLSTANLPTPTILKPNQHFDVVSYSGSNSTQSVSNLNFKPDLVWIKSRSTADHHALYDAVRTTTSGSLSASQTTAEDTTGRFTSFDSYGFTLPSGGWGMTNASGQNFVAWNWKGANSTTTNTSGTITSTVSANPTAGFSVVTYTGNATAGQTIGHGLGAEPTFMIIKSRGSQVWNVYHKTGGATNNTVLELDITGGLNTGSNINITANTTTFGVGSASQVNGNGVGFVAYAFTEVPGYSKFSSYTGNASSDGPFVYTGFKPKFIMIKSTGSGDWVMIDTSRSPYNVSTNYLAANAATGEQTGQLVDVLSNGFKIRVGVSSAMNDNGTVYTYAAFAETTMIPTIPSLPSVSSPTATSTTETTVTLGGTVDSIGGSDLTSRGICYGTAPSPTSCTAVNGTSTGTFSVDITGLASSTTYYYRVYATNVAGTAYSTDSTFTTEGITNSLLFDSSQTQYLSKTLTTPTNNKKYTFSTWVKRSKLASEWDILSANNAGTESIYFSSSDDTMIIRDSASGLVKRTAQVFRDPSAWLHVVLAVDTTQATASDRNRLYINGVENTAWVTNTTDATLNASNNINSAIIHRMGSYNGSLGLADGYQAETYFIDGQQLTPSYFGQTSTTTSMWIPKSYAGTYGNNGFHLNFSNANNLGKDTSGNANDWTLNGGINATDNRTIDTPLNNFATLNSAEYSGSGGVTYSGGNLRAGFGNNSFVKSSISITGRIYFEVTPTTNGATGEFVGVVNSSGRAGDNAQSNSNYWLYQNYTGNKLNGSSVSYGNTWTTNDVIGCAVDTTTGKIWWSKNGVWQNSGDPSSGSNPAFTNLPSEVWVGFSLTSSYNANVHKFNFGQRAFTYTPPTGFKSLSTANLQTPTIAKPSEHFDVVTYTGSASTLSIANLQFKPDFVWIKNRGTTDAHALFDDVRTVNRGSLSSGNASIEDTTQRLTSFDANGFTLTSGHNMTNVSGQNFVAWNWKGGNATTTNTAGSVSSIVSANPTAGFSVVLYTGTGANTTVGHGLGAVPNFIIFKQRSGGASSGVQDWGTYHSSVGPTGAVRLNLNNATVANSTYFNNATPTATVINLGSFQNYNELGGNYVAYAFSEIPGYSKFGSYTGNGSTDGPFVYTGFRPKYVMIKNIGASGEWRIYDSARDTYNVGTHRLWTSNTYTEDTSGFFDFISNGFKIRNDNSNGEVNTTNGNYIYVAFAETGMIPVISSSNVTLSTSNLEDVTVTPGNTEATIDYTTPSNLTFSQVVVFRSTQPIVDFPSAGLSYNAGDTVGSATVACVDSTLATSTYDSCVATGLTNNVSYYFKVFTKSGSTYSEVTSIEGSPSTPNVSATNIAISSYRLRNDNGDEANATYTNAENTPIVSSFIAGDKKRIRFALSNQTASLTKKRYRIEYSTGACTSWTALPRPNEVTSEHFRMDGSQFLRDNATTSHSTGISTPNGRSFVSGRIQSFDNLTRPITLRNGEYTELEYVVRATNDVVSNTPYCFRVTGAGNATDFTYTNTPQITPVSIVYRRQGGGGSSISNIIHLEAPVIVATTTTTGGGVDGNVTATSTSVEATSTPATQQSTTTPTRKRGGGGSVGTLKSWNSYAVSSINPLQGMVLGATTDVVCTTLKHTSVYGDTDRNTHDEVSHLQYFLKQKGYLNSSVNGIFGKTTVYALKQLQKDSNLPQTGTSDLKTRNLIRDLSCSN